MQRSALTSSLSRDSAHLLSPGIPAVTAAAAESGLNDVQSPRRRFPRVSMTRRCPATIPEHPDEDELWVDGPRSSICFSPQSQTRSSQDRFASSASSHKFTAPSAPSAELWVDGPAEFQTQLRDRDAVSAADSTILGNPAAVAKIPAINGDVTSSRPSRRSGEGGSKSRLPRTSANKNGHCHSSPRLRHSPQPVLDGRITAWVKSVQRANRLPDAAADDDDDDLRQPRSTALPESQELQQTRTVPVEDEESVEAAAENAETGSVAGSNHSLYEQQVDESLETASLRGCALVSSDEDAASQSNCGAAGRQRDGVPDGCADDELYSEKEAVPMTNMTQEDVLKTPAATSSGTSGRLRLVESVVRSSSSNSSRHGSSSPASQQRSASFPLRCLSSPRRNSGGGSQSPAPSRLKLPSTSRTSTPSSVRRSSGGVKSVSAAAAEDKIVASAKSQKSAKSGVGSRPVERSQAGVGTSSPKSCLPVVKKSSEAVSGGGNCLVSPYHTVTSPRRRRAVVGCSTSSDNSSLLSDAVTARSKSSEVELSSGYESMLRDDSDETITAHCVIDDWTSDHANHAPGESTHYLQAFRQCAAILCADGTPLAWVDSIRYLGVIIVRSCKFKCSFDNAKRSFFRSVNALFGKLGRSASEDVFLHLVNTKCLPILLYCLEVCPLNKSDLRSLDFSVTRLLMKLFRTSNRDIINSNTQ